MPPEKTHSCSWLEENKETFTKISDKIWELAELGLIESESSKLLADELQKKGFHLELGLADMPTAFVATWGKGKPVIGIMGEYDALPGLSQKKTPKKKPLHLGKPGHGCGHNIHGTSGMAAAMALKKTMEKHGVEGTVRFFGCPAEENFSGKVFMVRDGCFSGLDAAISHHPGTMNYGRAAHAGGSPDQGRSALDAVELMNTGVNFLREHVIQDARIHYIIEKGGEQPNIVPSYARSWYYVRAPERDQLQFIHDWIIDIAKGAAMMTRTELKHEFMEGMYNVIPNRTISELIVNNMRQIGTPAYTDKELEFAEDIAKSIPTEMKTEQLRKSKRPGWEKLRDKLIDDEVPSPWGEGEVSHGSTDVGDVSWQTPTVEFGTATCIRGTPGHSWQFVAQSGVGLGHKSLIFAAKVMVTTAIDLLMNENLLDKAKNEHKQRIGDKKYKSPIPPEIKPPLDIWNKSS
jgi:aminobenzoyl-glutamate utilization protein B